MSGRSDDAEAPPAGVGARIDRNKMTGFAISRSEEDVAFQLEQGCREF